MTPPIDILAVADALYDEALERLYRRMDGTSLRDLDVADRDRNVACGLVAQLLIDDWWSVP